MNSQFSINAYVYIYVDMDWFWYDITEFVISDLKGQGCNLSDRPNERMGVSGSLEFTLNNQAGTFNPGNWFSAVGTPFKLTGTMDDITKTLFLGFIDKAPYDTEPWGDHNVHVTALDYFSYLMEHPMLSPEITADKSAAQAVQLVLDDLATAPATDLDPTASNIFPVIFDTVRAETKAYAEISKIALSEMGYCYMERDGTLKFETVYYRNGLRAPDTDILPSGAAPKLLWQTGGHQLWQDGSRRAINALPVAPVLDDKAISLKIEYDKDNILNRITLNVTPRYVSPAPEVLGKLDTRVRIGHRATKIFTFQFKDTAYENAQVTAKDCIQPVKTTDYTMTVNKDGTGGDLSDNITVTAVFTANTATITVVNDQSPKGWLYLQVRGTLISIRSPITDIENDTDSQEEFGVRPVTIEQKYADDLTAGAVEAQKILNERKRLFPALKEIDFIASDDDILFGFFFAEIGRQVYVNDTENGIDGYFYINGYKYAITVAGVVTYKLIVEESLTTHSGLSYVEVTYPPNPAQPQIDFGEVPVINNAAAKFSVSTWVYVLDGAAGAQVIAAIYDDNTIWGWRFYTLDRQPAFGQLGDGHVGNWYAALQYLPVDQWVHLVVTHDTTGGINTAPHIYMNNVDLTLTQTDVPAGALLDITGEHFRIGNVNPVVGNCPFNGAIRGVIVFNKALTADEVDYLYSTGYGSVPDTLSDELTNSIIFSAPYCPTRFQDLYDGVILTSSLKLMDGVFRVVGTPSGSPTSLIY